MQTLAKYLADLALLFLKGLDNEQLAKATFGFGAARRYEFEYRPMERSGLKFGEMSDAQKRVLFQLLSATCSEQGVRLINDIINLENVLKKLEETKGIPSAFERSPDRYWVAFFGDPARADEPWGYQFSGHHIIVNATVQNDTVSLLPLFFGANPATHLHHTTNQKVNHLKKEGDTARQLLLALSPEKRQIAIASQFAPYDIITRHHRSANAILLPTGIKFNELTEQCREILAKTIKIYIDRLNETEAKKYWQTLQSQNFYNCQFTWAGSTEPNEPHYYAIHSKRFIIEYDCTQNEANHIHSVMRDSAHDWGVDLLGEHYKAHHT